MLIAYCLEPIAATWNSKKNTAFLIQSCETGRRRSFRVEEGIVRVWSWPQYRFVLFWAHAHYCRRSILTYWAVMKIFAGVNLRGWTTRGRGLLRGPLTELPVQSRPIVDRLA